MFCFFRSMFALLPSRRSFPDRPSMPKVTYLYALSDLLVGDPHRPHHNDSLCVLFSDLSLLGRGGDGAVQKFGARGVPYTPLSLSTFETS